jgi:hypothetical protein
MNRLTRLGLPAWLACLALSTANARGGTLLRDPYGVGAPDVLGSEADFDIRSLEVLELGPSSLQMIVRLNYHGGDASLAPFTVAGSSYAAVPVGLGDVLIQGQSFLWAVPLASSSSGAGPGGIYAATYSVPVAAGEPLARAQLFPGSLYRVTGTVTAGEVLGTAPSDDLRADEAVWGAIGDVPPDFTGYFPVAYGVGGPEIAIQLQIAIGPAFYDDVRAGYRLHFASTTCACDVIDARVAEPSRLALLTAALALLGARLCLARGGGLRERELV